MTSFDTSQNSKVYHCVVFFFYQSNSFQKNAFYAHQVWDATGFTHSALTSCDPCWPWRSTGHISHIGNDLHRQRRRNTQSSVFLKVVTLTAQCIIQKWFLFLSITRCRRASRANITSSSPRLGGLLEQKIYTLGLFNIFSDFTWRQHEHLSKSLSLMLGSRVSRSQSKAALEQGSRRSIELIMKDIKNVGFSGCWFFFT